MHIISYDIQDDRLRTMIAKVLIQQGLYRVQYSVFMGMVDDKSKGILDKQFLRVQKEKKWAPADTIFIIPLHQYSSDHLEIIGTKPDDWDLMNRKLHTLVL